MVKRRRKMRRATSRRRRRRSVSVNPRRRRFSAKRTHRRSAKGRHRAYGTFRYNKRRRHRRRVHRNPMGLSTRGVTGALWSATKDAAVILVGKAATNKVASAIPFLNGSAVQQAAKQVGVGLGLAMLTRKFAPRYAHSVLVGAILAPMETVLRATPVLGPALSAYPNPRLAAYPNRPDLPRRLSGYPIAGSNWGGRPNNLVTHGSGNMVGGGAAAINGIMS